MGSWFIYLGQLISIIIYFDDQIIPQIVCSSSFKLASTSCCIWCPFIFLRESSSFSLA